MIKTIIKAIFGGLLDALYIGTSCFLVYKVLEISLEGGLTTMFGIILLNLNTGKK